MVAAIVTGAIFYAPQRDAGPGGPAQSASDCPRPNAKIDLAFIIDRSGSLDRRVQGETYNIEVEGVRRAMLDLGVIPRDGSMAIAVFTFAGQPSLSVPFTEIKSATDAAAVATALEALKCVGDETCPQQGPIPATACGLALLAANDYLNANQRTGARRVLLISTDGGFTDGDFAQLASNSIRQTTATLGIPSEIEVILLGQSAVRSGPERIVFPEPPSGLRSRIQQIAPGPCNNPGAIVRTCADLSSAEVVEFAEDTRKILRSSFPQLVVRVNTAADPAPNSPVIGGVTSLRQAIEIANLNGGSTKIMFEPKLGTIRPLVPLPALTSPEITIDGGESPSVTIDGSQTDTAKGEKHSDGILLRSNRCSVRGLTITNFKRAGVGVEPLCSTDNVGFDKIESNTLVSNRKSGVCVLDPPQNQGNAVFHTVGVTISMNNISGSETPIDLGCDGPTPSDLGDLDEGPNTLLNYPEEFKVEASGNSVTISGKVSIPSVELPITDQSVVEVFAVTRIQPAQGTALVDSVAFRWKIPVDENQGGQFTMTFTGGAALDVEPTDGFLCAVGVFTATFTDRAGNTSELIPFCTVPPTPKFLRDFIEFTQIDPIGGASSSESFTIENRGCSRLDISLVSFEREGSYFDGLKEKYRDDSTFFSVKQIMDSGELRDIQTSVQLCPGMSQRFSVQFKPVIPPVVTAKDQAGKSLFAKQVLPADLISALNVKQVDTGNVFKLALTGRVTKAVKLIDPAGGSGRPKVTLDRSGDDLFVTFSVFDSNLDVNKVNYEFFKVRDEQCSTSQPVPAEIIDMDLAKAISDRGLIIGQSFSVIQRFSGALDNAEAGCVRVTVFDSETSASAISGAAIKPMNTFVESQTLLSPHGAMIVRPALKLPSSHPSLSAMAMQRTVSRLVPVHNTVGAKDIGPRYKSTGSRKGRASATRRIN
jgi:hypothetical protein